MYYFGIIIKALYFALPAYFANMAPVIFAKVGWLKSLNYPIDDGKKIGKQELFGKGKTWRGIVSAVILAMVVSAIQSGLYHFNPFWNISLINYPRHFLLFGFLAGLGAILGDLVKSFIKRRINISSGKSWPVFDQLDFIVGFLLFTYFLATPSNYIILVVILLTIVLHPLTNIIGYLLKIKKVWW
jgi:CDP-2,3-bis-(O-geranylgeranyl)-sn-glycerol synthase